MKYENLQYFFITDSHYWSKGDSFKKAFDKLKSRTTRKCECVVVVTEDDGAYIDDISGGVCAMEDKFTQQIGKFNYSQGRLTPLETKV